MVGPVSKKKRLVIYYRTRAILSTPVSLFRELMIYPPRTSDRPYALVRRAHLARARTLAAHARGVLPPRAMSYSPSISNLAEQAERAMASARFSVVGRRFIGPRLPLHMDYDRVGGASEPAQNPSTTLPVRPSVRLTSPLRGRCCARTVACRPRVQECL